MSYAVIVDAWVVGISAGLNPDTVTAFQDDATALHHSLGEAERGRRIHRFCHDYLVQAPFSRLDELVIKRTPLVKLIGRLRKAISYGTKLHAANCTDLQPWHDSSVELS